MNENQRIRVSVPISGIDTSTPDALVADGKCEKLHNLRFDGSSWWNVREPVLEATGISGSDYQIVYHHPAAGEDVYIAMAIDHESGLVALKNDYVAEVIYIEPRSNSGIVKAYRKEGENLIEVTDITISYNAENGVYSGEVPVLTQVGLYHSEDGALYVTDTNYPQVGDKIYNIDKSLSRLVLVGTISEISGRGREGLWQLRINDDFDLDVFYDKLININKPTNTDFSVFNSARFATIKIDRADNTVNILQEFWEGDFTSTPNINHFGSVLVINDEVHKENHYFLFSEGEYIPYSASGTRISTDVEVKRICPNLNSIVVYENKDIDEDNRIHTVYVHDPIEDENGDYLWAEHETRYGAWRGEIGVFCALRSADGAILYTSPIQIVNTAEDEFGYFRISNESWIIGGNATGVIGKRLIDADNTIYLNSGADFDDSRLVHNWLNLAKDPDTDWENLPEFDFGLKKVRTRLLPHHIMCKVNLRVSVAAVPPIADNIAIYCTRIHPLFSSKKHQKSVSGANLDYDTYVSADNLFEDPFYLVSSTPLANLKKGEGLFNPLDITLDYNTLQAGNVLYEPSQRADALYFQGCKEYNNRLHLYNIAYTPSLPDRNVFEYGDGSIPNPLTECCIEYTRNDISYKKFFTTQDINVSIVGFTRTFAVYQKTHMSFDVSQAKSVKLGYPDTNAAYMVAAYEYPLSYSYSLATSYIVGDARADNEVSPEDKKGWTYQSLKKYKALNNPLATPMNVLRTTEVPVETNRIQVSELNNPFAYPYAMSYKIGTQSNKIISINSAAIEMSDAKFGEMPLYAFTNEGIFALQSGAGTVLYSNIIPINYDRIINPRTLAINYNLIYITEEGVKSISSNQTTLLSKVINDAEDKPLLNYLRDAELLDFNPYGELIIHKPESDYAFVLALKGGYWATRDFRGTSIGSDKLYVCEDYGDNKSHLIFDLSQREEGETRAATLKTRPMKLGSHEFKRLETFIPRLCALGGVQLTIRFYGSNDRVNWAIMREVNTEANTDITLRRFPFSARYIYVEIEIDPVDVNAGFDISSFDIEYYNRFLNRLR